LLTQAAQGVLRLAVLTVLLGPNAALAATSGSAGAVSERSAGTSPLLFASVHEIMSRVYAPVVQYGMNLIGALAIFVVGRWGAIEENGLRIPFPQQEITIKTDTSAAGLLRNDCRGLEPPD
jgi:hypothetical protein